MNQKEKIMTSKYNGTADTLNVVPLMFKKVEEPDLDVINALAYMLVAVLEPFVQGSAHDRDRLMASCAPSLFQAYNHLRHLELPKEQREQLIPWLADLTHTTQANYHDPNCDLM
jgi:hypothetical protein